MSRTSGRFLVIAPLMSLLSAGCDTLVTGPGAGSGAGAGGREGAGSGADDGEGAAASADSAPIQTAAAA